MSSLWHWTQRADCTARNLSVGYWQVSRVLALAGEGTLALRFGRLCLEAGRDEEPFYRGYGHECIARAAALAGAEDEVRHHLFEAQRCLEAVREEDDRRQLANDLRTISVPAA
jgi:hypothetical protein